MNRAGPVLLVLMLGIALPAVGQRTWVVRPGQLDLADALGRATEGDRIVVMAGDHRLSREVLIDKRVEMVGEGRPALTGTGNHGLIKVTADGVQIRGLVLRNVEASSIEDRAAVRFENVSGCVVEDTWFEQTFFGVYLARSEGCRITGNRFRGTGRGESSAGDAIHLWNSTGTAITGNEIRGHRDGIFLEFARQVEVNGNRSEENFRYGLHFMFSDSSRYQGNVFRRNGAGVAVMYSKQVEMRGNQFEESWGAGSYGLLLKEITGSRLEDNRFANNSTALFLDGSSRLWLVRNHFERNGWAVRLMASSGDNRFVANRFEGNSFDVTTNSREHSSVFDGNEWDQYRGYDLDRDGVGDVPYAPVRLFALVVQQNEPTLILLGSLLVELLDLAERVLPVLTPATLVDHHPRMPAWR